MIFKPIAHDRTSREVERQIETLVLEGVLRVGDKLPGERELSKSLNISRPILREALRSLEDKHLLIARHGGGTYVADVIGDVFAPPVVNLIGTHSKARMDYLEYRREIESTTAALAAKRATDADKALLTRLMERMEAAHSQQDAQLESEVDVELHSAIGECAHNIILLHTLRSCYRLLSDDVFYNRKVIYDGDGMREQLLRQHKDIYEAVMKGHSDTAADAARNHILFVEKTTREMESRGDWNAISELRLAQRQDQENRRRSSGK